MISPFEPTIVKFGVPLRNQILSRGTALQLKKLIYASISPTEEQT